MNRICVLCGPRIHHRHTCATLIRHGLNVVGICEADQRVLGLPLAYVRRGIKRKGLWPTTSRVAARVLHRLMNGRKDEAILHRLFDEEANRATLASWGGEVHHTNSYSSPETLKWLRALEPDVLVVHTPYWVDKKVRSLAKKRLVLGGHPGLTPSYRGSHAAFWAIYHGKPEDVGCTVFVVDGGVDTGDVVAQERIPIEPGDSFRTLAWKGMIRTAELMASVLRDFEQGKEVPRLPVTPPRDSEYDNPTLAEYLRYRYRQRLVR